MEIEASDEITCSLCGSFLSVPPIIDVEDIGIVCGRCKDSIYVKTTNPKMERQSLYEKMAISKKFPCKYHLRGCPETPAWNDVVDHEKSCSFGITACFLRSKENSEEICEWNDNIEHVFSHFEDSHPDYSVTEPKVALKEILTKKYCMLLTEYSKTFILFRFLFDVESDSIYVMAATDRNEKAKGIIYELKMSDDEKKSMSFLEYSVLNCLYIGADVKKFGYKIKMSLIRYFPELDYIYINIGSKNIESKLEISSVSAPLKCDYCKTYLLPPSYFYYDSSNKIYTKICISCHFERKRFVCFRNYDTYNVMCMYTKFSCLNSSDGCNFNYSYSETKSHRNICLLDIVQCFLCDWNGRRNELDTHINEKHEISHFHESYDLYIRPKVLFKLDGEFLSCSVVANDNGFDFFVNYEQSAKYGYKCEIEIFSEEFIPTKLTFQYIADDKLFKIVRIYEKRRKLPVSLDLLEHIFPIIPRLKFKFNVSKLSKN